MPSTMKFPNQRQCSGANRPLGGAVNFIKPGWDFTTSQWSNAVAGFLVCSRRHFGRKPAFTWGLFSVVTVWLAGKSAGECWDELTTEIRRSFLPCTESQHNEDANPIWKISSCYKNSSMYTLYY